MDLVNESLTHVSCSCCDEMIAAHDAKENVAVLVEPYPCDEGFGWCKDCFGDDAALKPGSKEPLTEAQVRKALGWAGEAFYDARVEVLNKKLNPKNLERFQAMSYARKVIVIAGLIEKGAMI